MSDTPTEVLRAAAVRLRALADDNLSPAFRWDEDAAVLLDSNGDHVTAETTSPEGRWMAALGPQIAEPLARWMETTARYARYETGACSSAEAAVRHLNAKYAGALDVARSILAVRP